MRRGVRVNAPMETVFGLLGGLAVFLFGMNMMSESLQKAAGAKMNPSFPAHLNPVLGVLASAVVTTVLQSSSATTVMAIGFVSARLMTLRQAIAVIFGANIGTAMTAQLMAFKLSDYIWLIVFVGFIVWFAAKDERVKNIGQTVFAFGLLFVGIDTMGAVMKPLAQSEVFLAMIDQVKDIPALGVAAGTVMTLVVQSSSATIAVLQSFASQPGPDGVTSVLGLQGSIPILLGDNIGTTITALLACIGQSRDLLQPWRIACSTSRARSCSSGSCRLSRSSCSFSRPAPSWTSSRARSRTRTPRSTSSARFCGCRSSG